MSAAGNNHRIDYIELPSNDVLACKQFYSAVFGWPFTDYGPSYSAFGDGRLNGGIDGAVDRVKTPLVVLYASDLESTLSQIQAAGGTIVKPIFSFPGGRRFHFSDPAGNELAVWSDR